MSKMRDIFSKVKIQPVSANNDYTIMEYYTELSSYDRQMHDSRRVADQPGSYLFERVFPIASTPQDAVDLQEIMPLCDQLAALFEQAPARVSWPAFLRCCCCKTKKRTACCCRYTVLFGQIKQLGLILKTQFNAEHHWIKT